MSCNCWFHGLVVFRFGGLGFWGGGGFKVLRFGVWVLGLMVWRFRV